MSAYFDHFLCSTSSKVALRSRATSVTYGELGPITDHLADVLLAKDIGDTFFYLGRPGVLAHIYFLACLKAGKAFLSLNKKLTPTNIVAIVSELGDDRVIFTDCENDLSPSIGLNLEYLPALPTVGGRELGASAKLALRPDQIVLYNTTSGSTGIPKIVPLTFADLEENIRLTELAWDFGSDDNVGNPGEFCAEHMIVTLKRGSSMSFSNVAEQTAQITRKWLNQDKVSVLICYVAIFRAFRYIDGQFKYLKAIGTYGDITLDSDIELFNRMCLPGARYHSFLALQEIAYVTRETWVHGAGSRRVPASIGKPLYEDSVFLADEFGEQVEIGQIGEIVIRKPLLSNFINGYIGGRKGSGRLIKKNGNIVGFGTGDLAAQDEAGSLYFRGRLDDQVKLSGFNVRLLEVEQAIRAIDSVSDAAVTVQGAERESRTLCCHYVGEIPPLILRETLKAHLPDFMVPHHCCKVEELPRTATGKVDKLALEVVLDQGPNAELGVGIISDIKSLWRELLGHSSFGVNCNFLEVGGDSLALIKLSLAIEERTGFQIPFERFEQAGMSIAGLIALIENRSLNAEGDHFEKTHDRNLPQLTGKEEPTGENLLMLNRMILRRWNAMSAGRSKYFMCEKPDKSKIQVVWIFQTEAEYQSLTEALGDDYCVYGARSMSSFTRFFENGPTSDMEFYTDENVSLVAAEYVSEILSLIGNAQFILGGNCQAGIISLSMADILARRGTPINQLIILNAVEDRQAYELPTTLLFGEKEYEEFNQQPAGIRSFPAATVRQIPGDHGQYFRSDMIGPILTAIRESGTHFSNRVSGSPEEVNGS